MSSLNTIIILNYLQHLHTEKKPPQMNHTADSVMKVTLKFGLSDSPFLLLFSGFFVICISE